MDDLLRWRKEFPILDQTVYLISNSLGAMPRGVYESLREYAETWATRGVRAWSEGWWEMPVEEGDLIGALIGAGRGEVSLHPNTTLAEAVVLSCFDSFGRRKKVVMTEMDFPSVIYLHRQFLPDLGARVEMVPSDDGTSISLDRLLAAIDEETLLVSVSYVLFRSAFVMDVAAIVRRAHEVGAMVMLDAFHAVGTIPVDVRALGVDFLTGGTLKWLCGGPGCCFLYVRPDLVPRLEPRLTGWVAHQRPFAFDVGAIVYRQDAFRFLNGTPTIPCFYAARPGLEIIGQVGVEAIRRKSLRQTSLLLALAEEAGFPSPTPRDPERRGGTVTLDVPHAYGVSRELIGRGILVDFREGAGIRVAPHFYTRDDELEQAVCEIGQILESKAYGPHELSRPLVT